MSRTIKKSQMAILNDKSTNLINFMHKTIVVFERTLRNDFIEFSPIINEQLKKVHNRIKKMIKAKENPLVTNFVVWQKGVTKI